MQVSIVWFRDDLRLHDHWPLVKAMSKARPTILVYIIDPSDWEMSKYGFRKIGAYRTQFLLDCLNDLHQNLQKFGTGLSVFVGEPTSVFAKLAKKWNILDLYYHKSTTFNERKVENDVEIWASKNRIKTHSFWGSMLFQPDDLPFLIHRLPDVFTKFRVELEKECPVRPLMDIPTKIMANPEMDHYLDVAKMSACINHSATKTIFLGGETQALNRLSHYLFLSKAITTYKETRNNLLGLDYSSKLSPYLAHGCLSPKLVYYQLKIFEAQFIANESTYWLFFELLWREFFLLNALKFGAAIFLKNGIKNTKNSNYRFDHVKFNAWQEGKTGIPFIDANMLELAQTGFMSNRGRQNVASFLINDLKVDWRAGAAWFESQLIDYNPSSNYGNWNYIAGVGNDPRKNRYFNPIKQALQYDKEANYIKHWLPALKGFPPNLAHQPYLVQKQDKDAKPIYVEPIINPNWN